MTSSLAGRNAIVTGSSRGIGAQIALDLAKAGANVLLNHKSPSSASKAEAVMKEIRSINPSVRVGILHASVGDVDIGQKLLKASADVFADGDISQLKIHILVHNASDTRFGLLETETWESINDQLQANIRGPFLITQALRPHIPSHDNARIIFISSVSARFCGPGQTMYTASKAAIESFARTWNNEFGVRQGIAINAVNPGPVQTDLWDGSPEDFKKAALQNMPMGTPSDVSDVVLFLASKESRWISGSVVSTNGGGMTL